MKNLDIKKKEDKKNSNLAIEIGAEIARRRKIIGYTQVQMAKLLGIEQESLSRIEKGIIAPKFSRIEAIAQVLECRVSDLFLSTNENFENVSTMVADNISNLSNKNQALALDIMKSIVTAIKKHS